MGRDPERIPEVLDAVEDYWRDHPDLRLGQLLWAIDDGDPFYMEDDELLRQLERETDD